MIREPLNKSFITNHSTWPIEDSEPVQNILGISSSNFRTVGSLAKAAGGLVKSANPLSSKKKRKKNWERFKSGVSGLSQNEEMVDNGLGSALKKTGPWVGGKIASGYKASKSAGSRLLHAEKKVKTRGTKKKFKTASPKFKTTSPGTGLVSFGAGLAAGGAGGYALSQRKKRSS